VNSLPEVPPDATVDASSMPMERYFARECVKGQSILNLVRSDLAVVKRYCMGEEKTSNHIRGLMECYMKGAIPPKWKGSFGISSRMNLGQWIAGYYY